MATMGVLLGLSSGAAWGTADFMGGLLSRRLPTMTVAFWSQVAGAVALVPLTLAMGGSPDREAIAQGVVAGVFSGTGLLIFYRALALGTMSLVAPLSACGSLLPVGWALVTGAAPETEALLGIASAVAGIVLVSRSTGGHGDAHAEATRRSLWAALAAACCFGLFFVLLAEGADGSGGTQLWVVDGARIGSLSLFLLAMLARRAPVAAPTRGLVPAVVVTGLLDTGANALFTYGTTHGNVGVVSVLGSLFPVVTVLLALLLLAERLSRPQAAGVGLALLGVALIAVA